MNPIVLRWAVVLVDLDPAQSHEQEGTRRALVVSYEAFHRSGMAAVCPISAREAKYPGEVAIPRGHAGQTKDAVVLCHQIRTIDLSRMAAVQIGGEVQYVSSPEVRRLVRAALLHQFGLDLPPSVDGAR